MESVKGICVSFVITVLIVVSLVAGWIELQYRFFPASELLLERRIEMLQLFAEQRHRRIIPVWYSKYLTSITQKRLKQVASEKQ